MTRLPGTLVCGLDAAQIPGLVVMDREDTRSAVTTIGRAGVDTRAIEVTGFSLSSQRRKSWRSMAAARISFSRKTNKGPATQPRRPPPNGMYTMREG